LLSVIAISKGNLVAMTPKDSKYDTGSDVGSAKVLPNPPSYIPTADWQPFPGFSFLFDNPTNTHSVENDHVKLTVQAD
jgi:hypothetical protein